MNSKHIQPVTNDHGISDSLPEPLEDDQLISLAQQIQEIHANRNLWSFLGVVWGHMDLIDTVTLHTVSSMGKEEISAISVWDEQGRLLLPDLTLPFWAESFDTDLLEGDLEACKDEEGCLDVFNRYLRIQVAFKEWALPDPKDESPLFQRKMMLLDLPTNYPDVYVESQKTAGGATTIQAALHEYQERSKVILRERPLSQKEMRITVRSGEYVSGIVAVPLGDIIDHDSSWLRNRCSLLLSGTELLMDVEVEVVSHKRNVLEDILWLRVSGDASKVVSTNDACYWLEELVVFTREEAQAILAASEQSPWMDQGINETIGQGHVLPAKYLSTLPEGVIVPKGVTGIRRVGLFIDGSLSEVVPQFSAILGERRIWCAWPDSDFALVVPDSAYEHPMTDPVLEQLVQAASLEEMFHTLEDIHLTFVDLYEGYLIAQNESGVFEVWPLLPDGEDSTDYLLVVQHECSLYRYGNTYQSKEEIYPRIQHEIEK